MTLSPNDLKLMEWLHSIYVFRQSMTHNSAWVTPDSMNCIRFAFAKVGKAMDAWIVDTQDLTNERLDSRYQVHRYLTAAAVTLGTPFKVWELEWFGYQFWPESSDMDKIASQMSHTLQYKLANHNNEKVLELHWRGSAVNTMRLIYLFPGFDLVKSTSEYFNEIRRKYVAR